MKFAKNTDKIVGVKNSLPFKHWDLLIYSLTIILIVLLFVFLVILPKNVNSTGFEVFVNGKVAFSFDYAKYSYQIDGEFNSMVEVENEENGFSFKLYSDKEKTHFNVIFVNTTNKSVKMTDSNCFSKDCVYSPAISDKGVILCAPHGMKVVPIGIQPPTAG